MRSAAALAAAFSASTAWAQNSGSSGHFSIVGDGKVSAQQLFLGTLKTVYIVDKTEHNPYNVTGAGGTHPAWASEYNLDTNSARVMDIVTNSFCAAGIALGNGTWINAGGNQAITTGGQTPSATDPNVYDDTDGGSALRLLDPCDDGTCEWVDNAANYMTGRRWYPTIETLPNGTAWIVGGDQWGGFVNNIDGSQNNPTWELFPRNGAPAVHMQFLVDTLPANLYPLTYLTPDNGIFLQAGWMTTLYDVDSGVETRLPNVTHAVRTYPASGANAMLPQNKGNNWTAPIIFCGGSDITDQEWETHGDDTQWFRNHPNSQSCVSITPAPNAQWQDDDDLPEARSMGQFINLPDGRLFLLNGIASGVAGYNSTGIPYGTNPIYAPAYYNPTAASGKRWSRDNVQNASLPRLYHSSATLLADGSVLVAGSNPYADFQTNGSMINAGPNSSKSTAEWWSETRVEIFYPDYYSKPRPGSLTNITTISYGGDVMTASLSSNDIQNVKSSNDVQVVLIRPGFSTHAMQMGQRFVQLESTLQKTDSGATISVAPLPPNPAVLAPGPCMLFLVVNGVPSNATMVMVGSGQIETQPTGAYPSLPAISGFTNDTASSSNSSNSQDSKQGKTSDAVRSVAITSLLALACGLVVLA